MNDVTLFGNVPAQALTGALRKLAMSRTNTSGKAFMKFTKQGLWIFGQEEIESTLEDQWAVNPASFCIGLIGWRGGQVVGEHMFPITSPERVDRDALEVIPPKDGDGWSEQYTVDMKNLKTGDEVIYKTTSKGGKNAIAELASEVAKQVDADPALPVPLVMLTSDSYKHKTYGKIFNPVFEVLDWLDADGRRPTPKRRQLV